MTRVFIWKNNSPQEWEEISFSAFSKARRNGCFTGRFFVETVKMFRDEDDRIKEKMRRINCGFAPIDRRWDVLYWAAQ